MFKSIKENSSAEVVEKKSKFIANVFYIESREEAEEIIKKINKQYHDARHNCYAYRVISGDVIIEKSSDDGEPSGTAGAPMLNILSKNELANVLVVVTRYFGGILLGTGGLVRAYSDSTQKAIENCIFVSKVDGIEMEIRLDYANLEIFKYYCKNNDINITKIDYYEDIILRIEMEKNRKKVFLEDIETKTLNLKEFQLIGEKYIKKKIKKNK